MRYLIDKHGRRVRGSHRVDADGRKVLGQTEDLRYWVASGEGRSTVEATAPVITQYLVDGDDGLTIGAEPLRWAPSSSSPTAETVLS